MKRQWIKFKGHQLILLFVLLFSSLGVSSLGSYYERIESADFENVSLTGFLKSSSTLPLSLDSTFGEMPFTSDSFSDTAGYFKSFERRIEATFQVKEMTFLSKAHVSGPYKVLWVSSPDSLKDAGISVSSSVNPGVACLIPPNFPLFNNPNIVYQEMEMTFDSSSLGSNNSTAVLFKNIFLPEDIDKMIGTNASITYKFDLHFDERISDKTRELLASLHYKDIDPLKKIQVTDELELRELYKYDSRIYEYLGLASLGLSLVIYLIYLIYLLSHDEFQTLLFSLFLFVSGLIFLIPQIIFMSSTAFLISLGYLALVAILYLIFRVIQKTYRGRTKHD